MNRRVTVLSGVLIVLLVSSATAQVRVDRLPPPQKGGTMASSEFDLYGFEELPSGPLVIEDCTSTPCTFTGLSTSVWAKNLRDGTLNCFYNINNTSRMVLDRSFKPVAGAQYLELAFSGQGTISNVQAANVAGLSLRCTVRQSGTTIPCPGTTVLPFLVRQGIDGDGKFTEDQGFFSYHGMIKLNNDVDTVTVRFQVRSSDTSNTVLGQLCYGFAQLVQHYAPPAM